MERKDSQQDKERLVALKRRYERPEATFVPLKLKERLMGCGFYSNIQCGTQAAYQ